MITTRLLTAPRRSPCKTRRATRHTCALSKTSTQQHVNKIQEPCNHHRVFTVWPKKPDDHRRHSMVVAAYLTQARRREPLGLMQPLTASPSPSLTLQSRANPLPPAPIHACFVNRNLLHPAHHVLVHIPVPYTQRAAKITLIRTLVVSKVPTMHL